MSGLKGISSTHQFFKRERLRKLKEAQKLILSQESFFKPDNACSSPPNVVSQERRRDKHGSGGHRITSPKDDSDTSHERKKMRQTGSSPRNRNAVEDTQMKLGKTMRSGQNWIRLQHSNICSSDATLDNENNQTSGILVRKIDQINCYNQTMFAATRLRDNSYAKTARQIK